jgi:hypothetical protein
MDVNTVTGGIITFSGASKVFNTGANMAVNLTNNVGATINFTGGGLDIDTTSGAGFTAASSGTVTVQGTGNTITTTTGQILLMGSVSIGAGNMTFDSLTATGTVASSAIEFNDVDGAGTFNGGTVSVNSTSGAASDGLRIINGSAATFNFGATTIGATGHDGVELNGANGAVTFSSLSIGGSANQGVAIINATNTVNINGGTFNDGAGNTLYISGGTGNINIAASINKTTTNNVVAIGSRTGGTVNLSGNITTSAGGVAVTNNIGGTINFTGQTISGTGVTSGIQLVTNTGATINFNPTAGGNGLDLSTSTGTAFTATGGGTITVQGTGNSITTTTGTAVNINATTIGALGITWDSITANGASANSGIVLANTGNTGAFTVTGTTAVSSRSLAGISITGTGNATFGVTNVTGRTSGSRGIDIDASSGTLVFGNTTITNLASSDAAAIRYNASTGSVTFAQTNVDQNGVTNIGVIVSSSNGSFTSNGGTIQGSAGGQVTVTQGTGTVSIASAITNTAGSSISVFTRGAGAGNITFSGNINDTGSGMDVSGVTSGTVTFSGATKTFSTGAAIAVDLSGNTGGTIAFTNGGLAITTTSGTAFSATGGGTITVEGTGNTITTGTGTAVNISATTIGANGITWASVNTGTTVNGIVLDTVGNGFFTVSGGSITGSGRGVDINGGGGNVSIAANLATSGASARSIEITAHTAGTVNITGTITDNSLGMSLGNNTGGTYNFSGATKTFNTTTSNAVNLFSNTGATINFTNGGLAITTTSGTGFSANGGGTVTVQTGANNNTISTGTGTGLNVVSDTIGALGITFRSISSNGATSGIILNNTGSSGGLTVTGDGGGANNGSGGTIQSSTGAGISLTSTSSVNLGYMNIINGSDDGIRATTVNNITLNRVNVTNNGDSTTDEGVELDNISGALTITNTSVTGNAHNNLYLDNFNTNLASLTITGSTFSSNDLANGNHGVLMEFRGTTVLTTGTFSTNTVENNVVIGLQITTADTATLSSLTINGNTFRDTGTGNSQEIGIDLSKAGTSNITATVSNNSFQGHNSQALNFFTAVGAGTTGNYFVRITGNTIGNNTIDGSGSHIGNGIRVNLNGDATSRVLLDSNQIYETPNGRGIEVIGRDGVGTADVTITSNIIDHAHPGSIYGGSASNFPLAAIFVQTNSVSVAGFTMRADVRGNTVPTGISFELIPGYIALLETGATTLNLVDTAPASADATAQLTSTNTGSASANAGVGLIAGPINLPPLLFAAGGDSAAGGSLLTQASLDLLSGAAVNRWISSGVTADQLALLQSATFILSDSLPTGYLGAADGTQIFLSVDAAGNNWFVDATPLDDVEYSGTSLTLTATSNGGAAGLVDALTVIMHELGHVIGFGDAYGSGVGGPLMDGYLGTGQRLLPQSGSALSIPGGATTPTVQPLLYQAPAAAPVKGQPSAFHVPAQGGFKTSIGVPVVPIGGATVRGSVNSSAATPVWGAPDLTFPILIPTVTPQFLQPAPVLNAPQTQTQDEAPAKKVRALKRARISASR